VTLPSPPLVDRAAVDAAEAAYQAGVAVREVTAPGELYAIAQLFAEIWNSDTAHAPVSGDLLRAVSYAGNYVGAARRDGQLLGASVGFIGLSDGQHLHSHITGVAAAAQGGSVGLALKLHQRAWAVARGIDRVTWTFDPLVRRNAYFNLVKLGATIVDYQPNFYAGMQDGVNVGDESDRAIVEWRLLPGVDGPPGGRRPAAPSHGTVILAADEEGGPVPAAAAGPRLRAWIPEDIVELRRQAPERALAWRRALRATLGDALRSGYRVVAISRDGWYALEGREDR
jgi:predicted GNAT superfamily acetyltransferase